MDPTLPRPPRSLDLGRCFNDAAAAYKANFLTFFLAALIFEILSLLTLFVLAGPLYGGVCLMTLQSLRNKDRPVQLGELFGAFDRFGPLVGLFFLTLLATLLGFGLCVIPGLLLMTLWLYPTCLVVDQKRGVFDALGESQNLVTRRGFGMNFLLLLIVLAIGVVPALVPYAGLVFGWFVAPFTWLIVASAYLQQVGEELPPESDETLLSRPDERGDDLREAIRPAP